MREVFPPLRFTFLLYRRVYRPRRFISLRRRHLASGRVQGIRRIRSPRAVLRRASGPAPACRRHRSTTRRRLRSAFGPARGIPPTLSRPVARPRESGRHQDTRATLSHLAAARPSHLPVVASGSTPPSTAGSGCPKVVAGSRYRHRRRPRRPRRHRPDRSYEGGERWCSPPKVIVR
jgi:hypothetical protein